MVSQIDSSDGRGNSYATNYSYKDGLFDFSEREFRGFGYCKVTDSDGNYSESYFKQDSVYKGKPYKQETKDSSGNLYAKSENTWSKKSSIPGSTSPISVSRTAISMTAIPAASRPG